MAVDQFSWETTTERKPAQWEHATILHDAEADPSGLLNQLGADGWMFVAVVPVPLHQVRCYMRRLKR